MKNKVINAAVCDVREVSEDSLAGFDSITVNTAALITGARAKELMNKYPVTVNAAAVVEVPEGQDITVKNINGKGEIGPGADGTGVFLIVNGKLTIADGSLEAVKSYFRIMVNGKVLMPKSFQGKLSNISANGKTEYYPDGSTILKADTEIDDLFVARAVNPLYYCPGTLYFLDEAIDTEKLKAKGIRFAAKKIVITKSLVAELITLLDEEAKIVRVPDGTRLIDDDIELTPKTVRKYGPKLCVTGDVSVKEAEALAALEYLYADGTVSVNKELEDAFEEVESVVGELKIIDPELGYLADRPLVRVGAAVLGRYPGGVRIEDCAKVVLSEDLTPEDIIEKLHIADCAVVSCTKEQEEAVNMIAEDVAMIKVAGQDQEEPEEGSAFGRLAEFLGKLKDTQVINAVEYKM